MAPQPIARRNNWSWFGLLIVSTIPAMMIFALIFRYGVNVPYYDQWDCEGKLFKKFWENQLTWRDFWQQHNEHRMFFPKLTYLGLAYVTHWNVIAELIVTWLCVCVVSFSVYQMYRKAEGPITVGKMIPFIAANILIFTPACGETWLWGISVANLMPMAFIFGAMAIACSDIRVNLRWILCAALAVMATFSTASGLLCWILCAPLLFFRTNSSPNEMPTEPSSGPPFNARNIIAWACGFVLTTAIYFYHYARPAAHPPPSDSLKYPLDLILFLLLYAGNSITFAPPTIDYLMAARVIGGLMFALIVFLCAYVAFRWRDERLRNRALIWIMVGAYSIANGMLIAFSRMEITPMAATWTRYVSYSVFLPVSLIFLTPIVVQDIRQMWPALGRTLMRVAYAMLIATMVFQIFKVRDGLAQFEEIRAARAQRKAGLLFIDLVRFDSTTGRAWREQTLDDIRPVADVLNAHGWINPPLIQRPRMQDLEDATVTNPEQYGKLEQVGSVGDGKIGIVGWAYDPRRRSVADAVVLSWEKPGGDAVPFAIADMGIERLRETTESRLRYSGWQLGFPGDLLPAEVLNLRAWCLDTSTGKAVALSNAYRLTPSSPE